MNGEWWCGGVVAQNQRLWVWLCWRVQLFIVQGNVTVWRQGRKDITTHVERGWGISA